MTFRPRSWQRWRWPLIMACLASLLAGIGVHDGGPAISFARWLIVAAVVGFIPWSIKDWSDKVVIDAEGIQWKGAGDSGSLEWTEIGKLDSCELVAVTLVLRTAKGEARTLPFVTRDLYRELAGRLNRLGDDIEKKIDLL